MKFSKIKNFVGKVGGQSEHPALGYLGTGNADGIDVMCQGTRVTCMEASKGSAHKLKFVFLVEFQ